MENGYGSEDLAYRILLYADLLTMGSLFEDPDDKVNDRMKDEGGKTWL